MNSAPMGNSDRPKYSYSEMHLRPGHAIGSTEMPPPPLPTDLSPNLGEAELAAPSNEPIAQPTPDTSGASGQGSSSDAILNSSFGMGVVVGMEDVTEEDFNFFEYAEDFSFEPPETSPSSTFTRPAGYRRDPAAGNPDFTKASTPTFASSSVASYSGGPSRPGPPRPRKRKPVDHDSGNRPSKHLRMGPTFPNIPIDQHKMGVPDIIDLGAIEDIGHDIKMSSDHPSNVTGHFCDLFIGDHTTHGKVALKRPRIGPDQYTREDVRRFMREADTWRGYILNFLGTCRINGYLYMVSPYIDNGTLSGFVELHPEVDRVRLLLEAAEAVAYLHRSGVIHGDIKGTNILVSDTIHALLCDFGLTKFASTSTSTALNSAGSLRWQSPELWEENKPKTYESDTYAFGMTIAEILSGRVPFANYEQPFGIVMAAGSRNERPPTEPMFPPTDAPYYRTWRAAMHCWVKDPAKRPSMDQVSRMLQPPVQPRAATKLPQSLPPQLHYAQANVPEDTLSAEDK